MFCRFLALLARAFPTYYKKRNAIYLGMVAIISCGHACPLVFGHTVPCDGFCFYFGCLMVPDDRVLCTCGLACFLLPGSMQPALQSCGVIDMTCMPEPTNPLPGIPLAQHISRIAPSGASLARLRHAQLLEMDQSRNGLPRVCHWSGQYQIVLDGLKSLRQLMHAAFDGILHSAHWLRFGEPQLRV